MHRRVLITGANGYLGRALVARAVAFGDTHVDAVWHTSVDRLAPDPPAHLVYRQTDLGDAAAVARLFGEPAFDAVVHTAALLPDGQPDYLARATRANVLATAHLAEAAASAGVPRFVYCSSISVYGTAPQSRTGWTEDAPAAPSSVYGWSKKAGEECVSLACAVAPMRAVIVRLAGIHGGDRRGGALFHLTSAALSGRPLTLRNAGVPFQLAFIEDAVEAIWRAVRGDLTSRTLTVNVASEVYPSLETLARAVLEATSSRSAVLRETDGDGGGDVMDTARMRAVLSYAPPSSSQRVFEYCRQLGISAS